MAQPLDADRLAEHLQRAGNRLAPMYTVSGDEPLLVTEAVDALRASARGAGYTERLSMVMDARSDWSSVLAATQSVSLFGDRRILEIKIPTGKPGKAGADTLARLAEQAEGQSDADTLVLISLPRLDKATRESRWVQALARSGMMVDIASIERGGCPPGWACGWRARTSAPTTPPCNGWPTRSRATCWPPTRKSRSWACSIPRASWPQRTWNAPC